MKTRQLPYPQLARAIGAPELYFKREDEHHYGSHKGRSIPHMIEVYKKQGIARFVISSSGNAALAAILAVQSHNYNVPEHPLTLTVFVGKHIDKEKLRVLLATIQDAHVTLEQVESPKQKAFQIAKESGVVFLRQSNDDLALAGYHELAKELDHIPNLSAIFIPTSSGTTVQALGEAFQTLTQHPELHIVQTTSCHPIAEVFDFNWTADTDPSLAGAIVDHLAFRKEKVVTAIKQSHGSGWIVNNGEIEAALKLVENECGFRISPNSALAVAGIIKAVKQGKTWPGAVVCLITGR